jgi:AraC-like DNA-binding protein
MPSNSTRRHRAPAPDAAKADQGIVRVAALAGIVPLLRARGLNPAKVLAHVGLSPNALDRPDNTIHYRTGGQLLRDCAEAMDCVHFGLLVGQQNGIHSLGILGEMMRCSPTVHAALRSLILNMHIQTRGGVPIHNIEGDAATLGYAIYQRDMPGAIQVYDLVMAYEFNVLQALCGSRFLPDEVSFSHAKPKNIRPYRQFFHAPLRFDAEHSEIRFAKTWLGKSLPDHDAGRHRRLQRELAVQLMMEPDDYAEQVRRALRTMVPAGRASETAIAEMMSLPVRTLRWHLARQGTTFRKLAEAVRSDIARQLLSDTDMTASEIAESLDYADASAFTRAFQRWTGASPAAWRNRFRSADSGLRTAVSAWEE